MPDAVAEPEPDVHLPTRAHADTDPDIHAALADAAAGSKQEAEPDTDAVAAR